MLLNCQKNTQLGLGVDNNCASGVCTRAGMRACAKGLVLVCLHVSGGGAPPRPPALDPHSVFLITPVVLFPSGLEMLMFSSWNLKFFAVRHIHYIQ